MNNGGRRDSITGQFRPIPGNRGPVKRDSLHGMGIGFKRNKKQVFAPDEMDDIEILEELVHERDDFDWDKYAKAREHSVYVKQNGRRNYSTLRNLKDLHMSTGGAVERVEVASSHEFDEEEELRSVVSILDEEKGDNYFHDMISQISTDAKAKLKFIIEFAASTKNMSKASSKIMRGMDPNDLMKLRRSLNYTKLSRGIPIERRRGNQKNSTYSRSPSVVEFMPGELQRLNIDDDFAKHKGFKDVETMRKHLERVRGFEELKNETQIDLMARENGYRPGRQGRMQSVLNYLEPDRTTKVEGTVEDDMESMLLSLKNEKEDSKSMASEDGVFSDYDTETDYDSDVYQFMNLEADEDDIDGLMRKWEKVSFDVTEEDKNKKPKEMTASDKIRQKKKKKMKKRAIRRGWNRAKEEEENDFVHRRLRPYDSLTTRHMKHMKELSISDLNEPNSD